MNTRTARPLPPHPLLTGPGARARALALATAAVAAAAVLGAACMLGLAPRQDDALASGMAQHLAHIGLASSSAEPARLLAQRYLPALPPEARQRIGEQVREEQRTGATPSGDTAFVLRRLALYEAALQHMQASAATGAPPRPAPRAGH